MRDFGQSNSEYVAKHYLESKVKFRKRVTHAPVYCIHGRIYLCSMVPTLWISSFCADSRPTTTTTRPTTKDFAHYFYRMPLFRFRIHFAYGFHYRHAHSSYKDFTVSKSAGPRGHLGRCCHCIRHVEMGILISCVSPISRS
jgi:hypothetical protein